MAKITLGVSLDIVQAQSNIKNLKKEIDKLAKSFNEVKANKEFTSQIQALTSWNKSLADAVKKVTDATKKNAKAELELERYRSKTITQAKNELAKGEEKVAQERIKTEQQTVKLKTAEEKLAQEQIKTAKAQGTLADETKKTTDETEKQTEKTKSLVEVLTNFSITSKLLYGGLRTLKTALKDVNETLADTEKRIIAIQRVLPEGSVSDADLSNRLYDLAIEYGQSFSNVADIATEFARTGISYADTIEATRAALLALNVAELDTTQATEGMIAIMAQFSLSADQMNNVVDKLNKVADRFPVTTQKLMAALQRMGSSASIAGLSLDETIGIATTLSKATGRSGANVGTAANALIQYSTKEKALNTYASLSPEIAAIVEQYKIGAANVLDIWQALSKEINNLTFEQSEKLDVLAEYFESGEGAGLKDELEAELGDIFNDISGVFSTANTFRKNYFVALLQNMGTVEEAAQVARDSQDYSIKENEKEMQTYERRVTALQEHWHKLANDEQGWLAFRKGLVDIADKLLTLIEWTGGLRTTFIALGTVLGTIFGQKIISSIQGFITSLRTATIETTSFATALSQVYGIVGAVISVISIITGVVEQYKQAQHEENLAAIEAWNSKKENAVKLQLLYEKYKELSAGSNEYREVEKQIVSLLGDKATLLQGLTADTNKYRESVEKLTESEIANAKITAVRAAVSALEEFKNSDMTNVGRNPYENFFASFRNNEWKTDEAYYNPNNNEATHINMILRSLGYDLAVGANQGAESGATKLKDIKNKKDIASQISDYILYNEALQKLEEYALNSDVGVKGYIYGTTAYSEIKKGAEAGSALETALQKAIESYVFGESPKSAKEAEKLREKTDEYLASLFGFDFTTNDLLQNKITTWFNEYVSFIKTSSGEAGDALNNQKKSFQEIVKDYDKVVQSVKELADANSDVNEELTKQLEKDRAITEEKKARANYIKQELDAYLDGLKTESEKTEKLKSIEEARAKVEEARLAVEEKRKSVKEAEYALQKAQDELEYARNNRSERVFNAQTGMWEYQASQKNVQSAQEKVRQATENVEDAVKNVDTSIKAVETAEQNVQKAVDNLTKYLQDKAVEEIKKVIEENGSIKKEELNEILKNYDIDPNGEWASGVASTLSAAIESADNTTAVKNATKAVEDATKALAQLQLVSAVSALYNGSKIPGLEDVNSLVDTFKGQLPDELLESVREVLKKRVAADEKAYYGSDDLPRNYKDFYAQDNEEYKVKPFDSGGVLNGVGGIKATSQPEMIIDPELTRRILSPANNEAFERFANSLGIIFGSPMREGLKSTYSNTWSRSNNDNRSYYNINGVPIPRDVADTLTISKAVELFTNMNLV